MKEMQENETPMKLVPIYIGEDSPRSLGRIKSLSFYIKVDSPAGAYMVRNRYDAVYFENWVIPDDSKDAFHIEYYDNDDNTRLLIVHEESGRYLSYDGVYNCLWLSLEGSSVVWKFEHGRLFPEDYPDWIVNYHYEKNMVPLCNNADWFQIQQQNNNIQVRFENE